MTREISLMTRADWARRKRIEKIMAHPKTRSQKIGMQVQVMEAINQALEPFGLFMCHETVDKHGNMLFRMYDK